MAKKQESKERLVRVPCTMEGHGSDWIEFDTSSWGLHTWRRMFISSLADGMSRWVERDSTRWHLTGENGPVPHPGRGVDVGAWMNAYEALGSEGLRLRDWITQSPFIAIEELITNDKKSSAGGQDAGPRGETEGEDAA